MTVRASLGWILVASASIALALWLFARIEDGADFVLPLSFDQPASSAERADARSSVRALQVPAVVCIAVIVAVLAASNRVGPVATVDLIAGNVRQFAGGHRWLTISFAFATTFDLATTLAFCHRLGIDHEVHPGIRLLGYAFGRTAGPILAKLLQAIGILCIAGIWPRYGRWILLVATFALMAASTFNLVQMT